MALGFDIANNLRNASNLFAKGDGTAPPRIPMIFSCTNWETHNVPAVALKVNPHSVTFKQPKRITKKNVRGGTVYYHWSDENGRNNDILELQFKGKTGNIRAKVDKPGGATGAFGALANGLNGVARGLSSNGQDGGPENPQTQYNQGVAKHFAWSRIYSLTREPMINPDTKRRNIFTILYRSPLFPAPVLFSGFYNNVLDFGESADQPWLVEWSMSFIVQQTNPSLDVLSQYLATILATPSALEAVLANANKAETQRRQADRSATSNPFSSG